MGKRGRDENQVVRLSLKKRKKSKKNYNKASRGLILAEGELKAVDVSGSPGFNTGATCTLINGVARGDEISERIGRKTTMKSIQIRIKATSGTATEACRFLVVYDKQANAAALTAATVLNAATVEDMKNLENRSRFWILHDEQFVMGASGGTTGIPTMRELSWYRKVKLPVIYNSGDAGTVADITTGSLYVITIGSEAPGATASSAVMRSRVRYADN